MKSDAQKRTEAKARQDAYDKLSVREQLAKLDKGGFRAVKERARLNAILSTIEQVKAEEVAATEKKSKKVKKVA